MRPDLADIRLAEYVFAPHYVEPLARRLATATPLLEARDPASATLATLAAGETFEVLEFAGTLAWGIAPAANVVGYLPAASLDGAS